jgi:zinc ribbon protein
MTCPNCGAENPQSYAFCQNCGSPLAHSLDSPPDSSSPRNDQRNKVLVLGVIVSSALVCICACTLLAGWSFFSQTSSEASVQPTRRATPTRRSTASLPTDIPSDTPQLVPTSVSTPSVSAAKSWTTSQVTSAFRRAKLEISNPRPMTNDDYGSVPHLATEAIRFFLPSLGGQKGGRIYDFANANDLQTVKQYYTSGASGAASPPWVFTKDNILVQITGDLPENRAKQYQAALTSLQ